MRINWLKPSPPSEDANAEPPLSRQLLWFAALSGASLLVVSAVAYTLRGLLFI